MPKIRLVEKKRVAPLTEKEQALSTKKGPRLESMYMTPEVKKWFDAVVRDFKDYPDKKETGYEIEEILDILSLDEEDVETAAFAGLIDALSDAGYEMI